MLLLIFKPDMSADILLPFSEVSYIQQRWQVGLLWNNTSDMSHVGYTQVYTILHTLYSKQHGVPDTQYLQNLKTFDLRSYWNLLNHIDTKVCAS